MNNTMAIVTIVITLLWTACATPEPVIQQVEITREVERTVEVQVTVPVTRVVEQTVEVEVTVPVTREVTRAIPVLVVTPTPSKTLTPTPEPTPTPTPTPEPTPTPAPTPTLRIAVNDGTKRSSSIPYGQRFQAGVFDTQITSVDTDAWPELQAASRFNDPPETGYQYIMWELLVWNERGSVDDEEYISANQFELIGSNGVKYSSENHCIPYASEWPDFLRHYIYGGGSATGTLCFAVPSDEAGFVLHYEDDQETDATEGEVSVWFDALPD